MIHFPNSRGIGLALGVLILAWVFTLTGSLRAQEKSPRGQPQPAATAHLAAPDNLQDLARSAAADGRALLVLFSEPGCPWCERVRREFLLPMQRNAGYRAKLVFLQLDLGATTRLRDFAGREATHADLFKRYAVKLTPTVMLLGPGGEPLAEPLAGFTGSDFYGAYLDERIDSAVAKLKIKVSPAPSPNSTAAGSPARVR